MPSPVDLRVVAGADFEPLLGLPYREKGSDWAGVNCWGLAVLAYRLLASIELPTYAAAYGEIDAATRDDLARLIRHEALLWVPVEAGEERPLDLISLCVAGAESHIAVVIEPGRMLHVRRGGFSLTERYTTPAWCRRILGFYRHADLAAHV